MTLATPRASADHHLQLGFAAAAGPLADWMHVTVYVKGQLVWGTEPT